MNEPANGSYVSRAELAAHITRIDYALNSIDSRLENIEGRLDARPVQRWLTGRATGLIDRVLPLFLAVGGGYVLAQLLAA